MGHAFNQYQSPLQRSCEHAVSYIESLPERKIDQVATSEQLRYALGGPLPLEGSDPAAVIDEMVKNVDAGLIASGGPRFFGYAIGGALPASLAADWLVSAWDQNVPYYVSSPAMAVVEETAAEWMVELLGLTPGSAVGFTSGAQEAIYTGLITARNTLLQRAGWDVATQGLYGAPRINVVLSDQIHSTIKRALSMIGIGLNDIIKVPTDDNLRMLPEALRDIMANCEGPTLVCAQAGCIDSGAFDLFDEIADCVAAHPNAWCHVDGAIGLWAAASDKQKHLLKGIERIDSIDTDGHKWFNMPYDCGMVIVKDPSAITIAMGGNNMGDYLNDAMAKPDRNAINFGIAASRRARGVPVYAAFKSLGKAGIAAHLDNCTDLAKLMAAQLAEVEGITVLNDVVSNRFSVQFGTGDTASRDVLTERVVHRLQQEGYLYPSTSGYKGLKTMLISILNYHTSQEDVLTSVEKILAAFAAEKAALV
ncbi:pyridoxal phosphate-dependent decarboxylase family protein [Photobacterium aphoticum]|uniref:Amino acid decarboxylase n=1 Tax=Photobacterium aphoticum TaxID=754436 RepID=A0A0J1GFI2_9GAMM|nr:pyridoxal-dependent decarboxylase [Photobacterium aphoticum]KLU98467.1 amino acid decarboxylase [Photobacterium aphoticum]PSU57409.1 aspartate aminotransferase family protein [Photobacterium aphoticum]GHA63542.1 aspartate aminotransferase family protein [Photobacterium aphoticum]